MNAPPAPKVSVLLTVYKRTTYLEQAIKGVLAQTLDDYEIIVADDSHSPEIERICQSYSASGKLRYRHNGGNVGVARSIRNTLEQASGRYVAILNDDDIWEPDFLLEVVGAMEREPGCVLGFCDHWIIDEAGDIQTAATESNSRRYGRVTLPAGRVADPAEFVIDRNGVPMAMGAVFAKQALDPSILVPEVVGAYDLWMALHLAATGRAFCYVPKRLTRYRVHAAMETARRSADKFDCQAFIFSELIRKGLFKEMTASLQARLADAYFRCGRENQTCGDFPAARRFFVKSIQVKPHWRPISGFLLSLLRVPLSFRQTRISVSTR